MGQELKAAEAAPEEIIANVSCFKDVPCRKDTKSFARVADKYYQLITTPDGFRIWKYRDKQELKQDGVDLTKIPSYYGFTVEHNFLEHRDSIEGWLNLSQPLKWRPEKGEFPTIQQLFSHIFGEQLEIGFDRYSLLVRRPQQLQPILVLTSKEQGTGKSTLLYLDSKLFGSNAVILNISQYSQQFNGLFASKLMIGIDETIISEQFIKERLKQDSTAKTIQLRKMHTEHESIPFYGKFTLCTNRETDFARLDEEDMRFWVRKVGKIEHYDPDFDRKIEAEIPYFLDFLLRRKLSVPEPESRQWFSKERLKTDALQQVVANSRSEVASDILAITDAIMTAKDIHSAYFTVRDIWEELAHKYSLTAIQRALRYDLGMKSELKRYSDIYGNSKVGRVFAFGDDLPGDL